MDKLREAGAATRLRRQMTICLANRPSFVVVAGKKELPGFLSNAFGFPASELTKKGQTDHPLDNRRQ